MSTSSDKSLGWRIIDTPALVKMAILEIRFKGSSNTVVQVATFYHRIIWIINLHDGATLTIPRIEARALFILPSEVMEESSEDTWFSRIRV